MALNRTILHEIQRNQGAFFFEDQGWEIPLRFSSLTQEYAALRDSVGMLDLSNSLVLEVSGKDRVRFLHGMLSNDIRALQPGQGCYAFMLTAQGRIVADMQVYCLEDSFLLTTSALLKEKLPPALSKYIIGDQVELADRSASMGMVSLQGPKCSELFAMLGWNPSSAQSYDHSSVDLVGVKCRLARVTRSLSLGSDLLAPQEKLVEIWKWLLEVGSPLGLQPVGVEAWNTMRIEAGIPAYGQDMDETSLPLETNLSSAVSLTKGCYLGQEIVARATYVGHVNRKLTGFLLPDVTPAHKGERIFADGKEMGWITSSTFSSTLGRAIAMGYLRREWLEPGTQVHVERSGVKLEAEVTSLPFITLGANRNGDV